MIGLPDATSSRERVLQAAEQLFSERGYAAVTLRDIAAALGIKQASLYYHAPGGKEELFMQVTKRALERHRIGLHNAIQQAQPRLSAQLRAASRWLLSQPVMNYGRMLQSDLRAISEKEAERLRLSAYLALIAPLQAAFVEALPAGSAGAARAGHLAGAFLAMIEGVQNLPGHFSAEPKQVMADFLIDTWINGLQPNRKEFT
jgi:TetR/AcrR family transcriptional regulator, cholesterol catabolism regulator